MTVSVEWRGLEQLQAKLNRLANIGATLGKAMIESAAEVRTTLVVYPPAPPKPARGRWYLRGTGPIYTRKDGSVTVRKTSQHLNRSWSTRTVVNTHQAQVTIGSKATYAPYLHDKTKQAKFHGARGWRTAQDVLAQLGPKIVARIKAELDRVLGS